MTNLKRFITISVASMLGVINLLTPLSYASAATGYDSLTIDDLKHHALNFIMPNHNVSLYAVTEPNKYFVIYNGNTHTSGIMGTGTFTYDKTGNLAPNAFVKTGYTWSEWNRQADGNGAHYASGAEVFNWTAIENDEIDIYAQWSPNTYTIDYDLNKGSATSSPSHGTSHPTSATYDSGFTVNNPSMQGYTFTGWTISNMDTEKHTIGTEISYAQSVTGVTATSFKNLRATSGIVHFLATWSRNQNTTYKVKHYQETLEDGVYPATPKDTDNLSGPTDTEVTPSVKVYEGFKANVENTPASGNIDPDGNKVFRYEYTRNSYDLTLNAGRGVASVRGSGSVTAPDSTSSTKVISFKYDEPVTLSFTLELGYTGGTWSGYSGAASSFNMPASTAEKTASAIPITYTIQYDYNGGTATNPATYTIETSGFSLNNPTGTHSNFLGWTGGVVGGAQLDGTTPSVEIAQGSRGNRSYTAVWQCDVGYHSHNSANTGDINDGTCIQNENTSYKVKHYFQNVAGTDYIYDSSEDENKSGKTDTMTNETGNVYAGFEFSLANNTLINGNGTTVINVYYNRLSYTGTITKDTGVLTAIGDGANSPVSGSYKYEDTVTLTATTGAGYIFDGWTVRDENNNPVLVNNASELTATFQMPVGEVAIHAVAHAKTYTITYNLNSGTVAGTNPTEYTVVTPNITLIDPTRDHSVFLGWTGTDHNELFSGTVAVSKGSIGNREFVANWGCVPGYHADGNSCVANQYTGSVNYNDGDHGSAEEISFTYNQVTTLPNPSQSGYDFAGWNVTGMSGGVVHHLGTITTTGDSATVDSGATEFYNLSTEEGMTNITFTAIWTPRSDTKYVVYHYLEVLNGDTYELTGEAIEYTGVTDRDAIFSQLTGTFEGFTYSGGYVNVTGDPRTRPELAGVTTGNIEKHGSLAIYLYYDRNIHTVTLSGDEHVASLSWTGAKAFEYGENVTVEATAKSGYHFVRWEATPAPQS